MTSVSQMRKPRYREGRPPAHGLAARSRGVTLHTIMLTISPVLSPHAATSLAHSKCPTPGGFQFEMCCGCKTHTYFKDLV